MKTIKGPAIFLAQFAGDKAPFNNFDDICGWAASLGFKGVQIPSWDARLIDLDKAATALERLDREYLEMRARILDIASALDRIEVGRDEVDARRAPRLVRLKSAAAILFDGGPDRARRVQMAFSAAYDAAWRNR